MATSRRGSVQVRSKLDRDTTDCPVCGREVPILVDRFDGMTLPTHNVARVRRNKRIKVRIEPIIYATKERCEGSGRFIGRVSK